MTDPFAAMVADRYPKLARAYAGQLGLRDRDAARRAETRMRLGCLSTGKPGPSGIARTPIPTPEVIR